MRVICYRNRHAHPGQSHCCGYVTPIIVAGLTIALGASCVAFYVLLITRNPTVAYTVALSVVFSIISIFIVPMVLWSYYVVVFTSPGFVPRQTWSSAPTYCPSHDTADVEAAATALEQLQLQHERRRNRDHDDEEDSGQAQILSNRNAQGSGEEEEVGLNEGYVTQLTGNGELRFCHVCKVYKPDDAHHCSQCQRCVLKFDHHCPYINNCVGRNNYKVFLIFILYAGVGCTIAAVLMAIAIFTLDRSRSATGNLPWLAPTIILACIGLTLDAFYLDHRRLLARGDSSLTAMQKEQKSCMNGEGDVVCCAEAEDPDVVAQRQRKEVELARRHRRVLLGPPEERNRTCCRALLPIPARQGDEVDETLHPAHAVRLPNDGNGV